MNILGYDVSMSILWLVVAIACGLAEFAVTGYTIGFMGGALAALVTSLLCDSPLIQLGVFVVVTIILIFLSKEIVEKKLKTGDVKTNVEAIIGQEAVAISDVTPPFSGQVKVGSMEWSAIMAGGYEGIEKGEHCIVQGVDGVKLIIKPMESPHGEDGDSFKRD